MTNEDIIKALQYHDLRNIKQGICKECPYYNVVDCYNAVIWNAIEALRKEGTEKDIEKVCKNCDYYFYGQCYGQKNAPKVDANEIHNCWTERK